MPVKTISAREFNQNTGAAKRAAKKGPVYVTDRGRATHVLLTVEEFDKLVPREPAKNDKPKSIGDLLTMPEGTPEFDFDFESYRSVSVPREMDFD